jgi:hypothetical protein
MSSIESRIVPDTVQLIVEVAGLCASAPALETMRPPGIAPLRQRPHEALVPVLAAIFRFDVGQRAGDPLVGVVHRVVEHRPVLGDEPILLFPDIQRCGLEGDVIDRLHGNHLFLQRCFHYASSPAGCPPTGQESRNRADLPPGCAPPSRSRPGPDARQHNMLCYGIVKVRVGPGAVKHCDTNTIAMQYL